MSLSRPCFGQEGPSAVPASPPPDRLWFAQALRAVACLTVVGSHYIGFVVGPEVMARLCLFPPPVGMPQPWFVRAYGELGRWEIRPPAIGVALFFLVSGFVIPYSLGRNSLGGFFVRRFFRLYPTLWLVQLVVLLTLALQASYHGIAFPYRPLSVASNALLVNSYLGHPFVEAVCWTLLVEELFYAICALCAWARVLDKPAAIVAIAVVLAGVVLACSLGQARFTGRWHPALFWLARNSTFVVFIFLGTALHYLHCGAWGLRGGVATLGCLLGLFTICTFAAVWGPGETRNWIISGLFALALFIPLMLAEPWLPYSRWVDRAAAISYPLYLTHATLGYSTIRIVYLSTGSIYLGFAAAFAGAVALSALLHRFVERPGNEWGRRLAARLARRPAPSPVTEGASALRRAG